MSRELDILRAIFEAFSRGDFDEMVQYLHPDVELRPALQPLEHIGVLRGRTEIKEFFEGLGLWESRRVELEEVIEVGHRLFSAERWHVVGRDGIKLDFRIVDVYTFEDGLIFRVDGFRDRAEALEAVGLSE